MKSSPVGLLLVTALAGCQGKPEPSSPIKPMVIAPVAIPGETVFTCSPKLEDVGMVLVDRSGQERHDVWTVVVIENPAGPVTLVRAVWATLLESAPTPLSAEETYTFTVREELVFSDGMSRGYPCIVKVEQGDRVLVEDWHPLQKHR